MALQLYVSGFGSHSMASDCLSTFLGRFQCLFMSHLRSSQTGYVESDSFEKSLLFHGISYLALGVVRRSAGSSSGRTS